jgi:hypothetical protein
MDQALLVKSDRDIGAQVMEALSRVKIPVTLCEWTYVPQLEEWQLIIATPWYDSKGPQTAYRALVDALQKAEIYPRVPMRRVSLRSPSDPVVKALQAELKDQNQGSVHVLKHGDQYSVIFAHVSGEGGGPISARRFSNPADLKRFLAEDLNLRPSAIEDAFGEVKYTGTASVHPVFLTTRELKKLGLD